MIELCQKYILWLAPWVYRWDHFRTDCALGGAEVPFIMHLQLMFNLLIMNCPIFYFILHWLRSVLFNLETSSGWADNNSWKSVTLSRWRSYH